MAEVERGVSAAHRVGTAADRTGSATDEPPPIDQI